MFVVLAFCLGSSMSVVNAFFLFRASGNVGAIPECERNDDRYHRYIPA